MDIKFLYRGAQEALRGAKRVLTISHKRPDGDTLGSATAFSEYCRRQGIAVTSFCLDQVPDQYSYLPGIEHFIFDTKVFNDRSIDVIAVFDSGDLRYAGVAEFMAAMPGRPFVVAFDHHATNDRFADVNVIDATASSTAEVVYNYFQVCGVDIDAQLATCLLTGIFSDTDSFTNPATSESALQAASFLIRRGAKIQTISGCLTHNKSVSSLRLWGQVLSRLKFDEKLKVASTAVFADDCRGLGSDQVEGIANFLGNFLDAKVVLVLKELAGGLVKGSFRTAEDVDISVIAKALGGGGHRKAAGFTIPGSIKETDTGWRVD
jgi:phosphoesterase RecJ-like protein